MRLGGMILAAGVLAASVDAAVITFTDVTDSVGMTARARGRSCAFFDLENDGDMDLIVWNDDGADDLLYRNDGTGHFTEIAALAGTQGPSSAPTLTCGSTGGMTATSIY